MLKLNRLSNRIVIAWLFAGLAAAFITRPVAFGQEERREKDTRDERREREKKANDNPKLNSEGDRIARDGDRLAKEDRNITRDSDRLDRDKTLSRDGDRSSSGNDRLARESRDTSEKARERGFRSEQDFEDHYQKHKGEYGNISREEYLKRAQTLRDTPPDGKNVKEIQRGDDRTSKYDTRSNDFGVYERDGTVVTYFKPTQGERYFNSQAEARK